MIDLSLPDLPGVALTQRLRREGITSPIVVFSGRTTEQTMIAALDAGADDFIAKPVSSELLLARLRAALRRGGATRLDLIQIGPLVVDRFAHTAKSGDTLLDLTRLEYYLLEYLIRHRDRVVTRVELLQHVWNTAFDPGTNVLETTISRLRAKLPHVPHHPEIRTVRNRGYQIVTGSPE